MPDNSCRPYRGFDVSSPGIQGLTPLATACRPYGTEEPVEGSRLAFAPGGFPIGRG